MVSTPNLYRSSTLLTRRVPIKTGVNAQKPLVWVSVGPLVNDDILDVRAQLQATNDNLNFSVAWNMYVTLAYDGITFAFDQKLDYSTGRNLLRAIHHDGLVNSFLYKHAAGDKAAAYVCMCVTAKPLQSGVSRRYLNIDYGMLTVRKN